MINLAENLEGRILNDKWRIISKKNIAVGRTPGQFSICYLVEEIETKKIAFLKAFDIQSFIKSGNSAEALKLVAEAYLFEKNLLERCKDIRLRRVVVSIDYGEYIPKDALYPVYFLIFEMADDDIRKYTDLAKGIDIAWLLKVMHTVAVGVQELHNNLIAHQDLKPANILVFNENLSKIGDLGRAWSENINSPFDSLEIPGDKRYAPIEYLYGNYPADEKNRRFIYDLYSLGNMLVFVLTNENITANIISRVGDTLRPKFCYGSYDKIVSELINAFEEALLVINDSIPDSISHEVIRLVRILCTPDLSIRMIDNKKKYTLQQVISRFDVLATKTRLGIWKV